MECKGSSNGFQMLQEPRSGMLTRSTNQLSGSPRTARTIRDNDQYMPIANIIRIMRRILPNQAKISDDAKEAIQECVSEYISLITGEANERCQREQRKTITADDILWAMNKLGFEEYVRPLSMFLCRYRELETDRNHLIGSARGSTNGGTVSLFLKHQTTDMDHLVHFNSTAANYVPFHQFTMRQQQGVMGTYFVDGSVIVNQASGQQHQQAAMASSDNDVAYDQYCKY